MQAHVVKGSEPPSRSANKSAAEVLDLAHGHHGDVIAAALGVDIQTGLSDHEVRLLLARDGPDSLGTEERLAWLGRTSEAIFFSSIVVWLLLAAATVARLTSSRAEAFAILIVLVLNAVIGFAIEWRAGRALHALRRQTVAVSPVSDGTERNRSSMRPASSSATLSC